MDSLHKKPDADALSRLAALARSRLPASQGETRAADSVQYARVMARFAKPARMNRLTMGLGASGLAAAAVVTVLAWPRSVPLEFSSGGVAVGVGAEVVAPPATSRAVHFSDGTDVTFAPTARGQVAQVSNRGAHVRLHQGSARVKVVPRKNSEWFFSAGPCEIRVTGTSFDLAWSESARRMDLAMHTGSVVVKSPLAPEGIRLRAGERLIVDLDQKSVRRLDNNITVSELPAAPPSAVAPSESPAPVAPPSRDPVAPRREPAPSFHRPGSWVSSVAAGQFGSVVGEARREGLDSSMGRSTSADLLALADAARFTGDVTLARRALLATRARFANSHQAQRAALQLGRMAEDGEGDLGKALEWYDIYLASAPQGAHIEEALGRKMTATLRLFGRTSARTVAESYLRKYPAGAYARAARAIVVGTDP